MAFNPGAGYNWGSGAGKVTGSGGGGGGWLGAAIAAAPAIIQGVQGLSQKNKARKLNKKDFDFMPVSLSENKALAQQQAYSRVAPGQALAGENIRRNQANTLAAAARMYGGDTNKMGAVASGANVHANDATKQVATLGKQFSENAFNRIQSANSQIAGQERKNYDDFWKTKSALLYASDQNIYNAINNVSSVGVAYLGGKSGYGGMSPYMQQYGGWAPWMTGQTPYGNSGMVASGYSN